MPWHTSHGSSPSANSAYLQSDVKKPGQGGFAGGGLPKAELVAVTGRCAVARTMQRLTQVGGICAAEEKGDSTSLFLCIVH